MKTLFSIALLGTVFLVSCSSPKPLIGVKGDTISDEIQESKLTVGVASVDLYSRDKSDTLKSYIDYMFYTNPVLPYQDSVNRLIKEYVSGTASNGGGMTTQDSELSREFFTVEIEKYEEAYNSEMSFYDDGGYFGSVWSTETTVSIREEKAEYVEISFSNWNYSGGAHGNAWSEEILVDLKTGRRLTLDDFFNDVDKLTDIAELVFRADQELPDDLSVEEAGFWFEGGTFQLNNNFVFNENSIDFMFNQYEIAPYSAGMIYLSIPMDQFKSLLKRRVD